jgi:hypothetical protein
MPLTLRPTGLSSPAYRDWADYIVRDDGRDVGRIYEDRHSRPELRWFWAISIYVNTASPQAGARRAWTRPRRNSWRAGKSAAPTHRSLLDAYQSQDQSTSAA